MKCDINTTTIGWGLAVGVALGMALGASLGHMGSWIAIGAGIGLLLPYLLVNKGPEPEKPGEAPTAPDTKA
jgi:H+/Cl- antiporter ClcA